MATNPLVPRTYLDNITVRYHLQVVERSPESHGYIYKGLILAVLTHFFDNDGFNVQQGLRDDELEGESRMDMAVVQFKAPPGGSMHAYDYCLVESKKADMPWMAAHYYLSRRCAGTENVSRLVYGIVHVGLYIQFYAANRGVLTALSDTLHIRNDVARITERFEYMKSHPFSFV